MKLSRVFTQTRGKKLSLWGGEHTENSKGEKIQQYSNSISYIAQLEIKEKGLVWIERNNKHKHSNQ